MESEAISIDEYLDGRKETVQSRIFSGKYWRRAT